MSLGVARLHAFKLHVHVGGAIRCPEVQRRSSRAFPHIYSRKCTHTQLHFQLPLLSFSQHVNLTRLSSQSRFIVNKGFFVTWRLLRGERRFREGDASKTSAPVMPRRARAIGAVRRSRSTVLFNRLTLFHDIHMSVSTKRTPPFVPGFN